MTPDQFLQFAREAVHERQRRNGACEDEFRISDWPRWDYDFDAGTMTFSQDGVPKVIASIQVVGSTSISGGTWLWSWANEYMPGRIADRMGAIQTFGEVENLTLLTEAVRADEEHLGWKLTAIAAKLLDAKGGYRCPGENGFV